MIKKLVLFYCVCIFCASSTLLYAGTLTYERANQLYHNQEYAEALELYNQMIAEGLVNASVYYNAGNTYYKLNKMGWAVWCYENAQILQPNNVIVQENLQLAIRKINTPLQKQTTKSFESIIQNILQFHPQNNWAIGSLSFFLLAISLLIIKKLKAIPPIFIALRKLSWILFGIYFIGTIGHYVFHKIFKYGIIVENTILYNSPKEKGLHKASQTKGIKVQILSFVKGGILNENKYKIKMENGNIAWVDENTLKAL
jgi:tetratricopeptide (TPR) repeat protein